MEKIIRFILIGGLNTLVGYSLYSFFIFLGIDYALASLLSTGLGILFNFKFTGKIVFNNKDNKNFVKFFSTYILIYCLNLQLVKIIQLYTSNLYFAGFILIIPSTILSFTLNKYFVFKDSYETD